ncbi:MAG: Lrp/AsnC family transcriptional regulator [Pseudonocardiaceae bacterium]
MLVLDDTDRCLIHALHIDARAPFTKISAVLDTSTQTVVRRYTRLRAAAALRVVALPDPHSARRQQWIVRLTAAANGYDQQRPPTRPRLQGPSLNPTSDSWPHCCVLGITTTALLWMSVAPTHLDQVATTLASHEQLAVVAATTGPTNLLAMALCPDPEALHHYLINRLAFDTITNVETAPVLQTLKATAPVQPR